MADLPERVDLTAYHGDTWSQLFRLLTDDVPVDLTGATVESWAISRSGATTPLAVALGDPGEITIGLPADGLDPGAYRYDIEVTDAALEVRTWIVGKLTVQQDITND